MTITTFIINKKDRSLTINFVKGKASCLSFEYLRVFPAQENKAPQKTPLITHKKHVVLNVIEQVGKHGYRFIFDDQHSAIYSAEYLELLIKEYEQRWQNYLAQMKASNHSREAIINITQL